MRSKSSVKRNNNINNKEVLEIRAIVVSRRSNNIDEELSRKNNIINEEQGIGGLIVLMRSKE
jgi:phosphohistidine swiveling domain-containing protein